MQLGLSWMRLRKLLAGFIAAIVLAAAALVAGSAPADAAVRHTVKETTVLVKNDPVVSHTMSFVKRGNSWS